MRLLARFACDCLFDSAAVVVIGVGADAGVASFAKIVVACCTSLREFSRVVTL